MDCKNLKNDYKKCGAGGVQNFMKKLLRSVCNASQIIYACARDTQKMATKTT